ncbi:MAG: 50S ribosomal protein L4 [Planctomycetaceae bacterium]
MISVPVHNASGKSTGEYNFDPADIAPGVNKQLLHDVVVMYESNKRVGTVRTKSRGEVEGSTRKLFRQKGTGHARMGTIRTPTRRGGGHAFAKRPIDWSYRMPKKAMRLATRMALLSKFLDKQVTVLDGLTIDAPKTKVVAGMLRALGLGETSCLLVIDEHDANIWKSSRNIANLAVSSAGGLNAYDLLHQRQMIVTKSALDRLRASKAK